MESLDYMIAPVEQMVAMMEANPVEKETIAEQQKVPKEEATVKTFGAVVSKQHVGHAVA
jgi:hypothetical protein